MQPFAPPPHVHKHRLAFLDSIRALCAFGVIYLHASLAWQSHARPVEAWIFHFASFVIDVGKIGVIAFFMVSGFVIPISLKVNQSRAKGIKNFIVGRFFRLYPAYWLSIIAALALFYHWSLAECPFGRILLNATMFQRFFGGSDMIGLYWTLQIEWLFYIVCIVLYALESLDKPGRILKSYFVFLAIAYLFSIVRYKTHRALPLAAPLSLAVMLLSTLWRMVTLDGRVEIKPYFRAALWSFVLSIPLISVLGYNFDLGHQEIWYRYVLCYWIAVGLFLLCTSKWKMNWRPLAIAGQASYSLYLFNEILQNIFQRPFLKAPVQTLANLSPNLYLAITLLTSIAVSLALYNGVEKPMIKFGRKFSRS